MWQTRLRQIGQGAMKLASRHTGYVTWGCGRGYTTPNGNMGPDVPCAHHTARVGYILLKIGGYLDNQEMIKAGLNSATATCNLFNWHEKEDGRVTISYFTETDDETINIFSDVAMLLAQALTVDPQNQLFRDRLDGLVRSIITELDQNGRWAYLTRDEYKKTGFPTVVDNLHTAMVISGLVRVLSTNVLEGELAIQTVQSVKKGASFYFRNLFRNDGFALRFDNTQSESTISGYCEGVFCAQDILLDKENFADLAEELKLDGMIKKILDTGTRRFTNFKKWDVASKRIGRFVIHIQSVRWGSGLLMEAISRYLAWQCQEGTFTHDGNDIANDR